MKKQLVGQPPSGRAPGLSGNENQAPGKANDSRNPPVPAGGVLKKPILVTAGIILKKCW
jgi:hypothetical protein